MGKLVFCLVTFVYCSLLAQAQLRQCLNTTEITKAVHDSKIILTGKIIELEPILTNELGFTEKTEAPPSAYYYYSSRKKRGSLTSVERWKAKVKVKTVFKGNIEKGQEGQILQLTIGGNESYSTCPVRRLRTQDTRVFFFTYVRKFGQNFEDSSRSSLTTADWLETFIPLPPTLVVLTTVRQVLKDDPCSDKECRFGGHCVTEGGTGVCTCVENCPMDINPLCGMNDLTFINQCHLSQFECKEQMKVGVKYAGECEMKNPCQDKVCSPDRECVVISEEEAGCPCRKCDLTQLTDGSESIVCGSDGKEYGSQCDLDFETCETGKNVTLKYLGKCDPCAEMTCASGDVCRLNEDRQPSCQCAMNCAVDLDHVCASNGKTYNSECALKEDACRSGQDLRIVYRGKCSSGVNPCDAVKCHGYESCVINRLGFAQCLCHFQCQPILKLVCGSDDLTYGSECELMSSACLLGKDVTVAYLGSCEACAGVQCKFGARCEAGACVCPQLCPSLRDPVCGSNSVTYNNECELQKYSCQFDAALRLDYNGECIVNTTTKTESSLEVSVDNYRRHCLGPCHKLGSFPASCEPVTNACLCLPGVSGIHCDHCLPGFWGLQHQRQDLQGCQACDCSPIGSLRDDCDQMTGQCECKNGVGGRSCDLCVSGEVLGWTGCPIRRMGITATELTGIEYTEPGDDAGEFDGEGGRRGTSSVAFKSTRHLQPISLPHRANPVTFQMRSYLSDSCFLSTECVPANSLCVNGWCVCAEGFYEDSGLTQCKRMYSHASGFDSCARVSCEPSSTCFDYRNGSYACACPLGEIIANGIGCRKEEVVPLPLFDGSSWIRLGRLGGNHKLSIEIQITPTFSLANGILIYAKENGGGKFVSLSLQNGFVEFRYDLGSGPLILRSTHRLEGGSTYEIAAKRYNRDGLLRITDFDEIKGSSPGHAKSINLSQGTFLGYVPENSSRIWEQVETSAGFVGCMHKLTVGRRQVEFEEAVDSTLESFHGVHQCFPKGPLRLTPPPEPQSVTLGVIQSPCLSSPCQNHGECWTDRVNAFRCVCHPQYSGKVCDQGPGRIRESSSTLDFRGFSYLELPTVIGGSREIDIELWFWPRSPNGILLYTGQEEGRGDFLALVLSNALLSFAFDLGSGIANVTWSEPLQLHKWHWILASRQGRQGSLQVNGGIPVLAKSPPTLSELNLELPLFIGGVPDENILVRSLGIPEPFDGTLQHISVNGELYTREIEQGLADRLLQSYEGPPCGSSVSFPCYNGGSCYPRLNNFVCVCPPNYTGLNCQIRKPNPNAGPVRFTGKTFLKFPRKGKERRNKVQRRNEIELLFKTRSESPAVLLWIGKSDTGGQHARRGYLGLFLVEGYPELRLDLGPLKYKKPILLRSKMYISDGRWHHILIVRRRRLLVFQVDGTTPQRATAPGGSNVLVSDGQLWIGGVGGTLFPPEIPPMYHSGFRGCIDVLKVERRRVPLGKVALGKGLPTCAKEEDD